MNIFVLDDDTEKSAQYNVDRHVVKIPIEIAQLLSNSYMLEENPKYKPTHINHPWSKFTRESLENFNFVVAHGLSLCKEYTFRYGKVHACEPVIRFYQQFPAKSLINKGLSNNFPRCFGDFKNNIKLTESISNDYREYYKIAKSHLFNWKNRQPPNWI